VGAQQGAIGGVHSGDRQVVYSTSHYSKTFLFLCGTGRYLYTDGQPECGERGAIFSSFVFHIVYVAERLMHE
jgi:hypothetical protein